MCNISLAIISTDFDEETADDKDIDMGIYYGHSEGNSEMTEHVFICWIVHTHACMRARTHTHTHTHVHKHKFGVVGYICNTYVTCFICKNFGKYITISS